MPGAVGNLHLSRQQARALLLASRELQAQVADLAGELPFVHPPTLAEVQADLPVDDLRCVHVPQPHGPDVGLAYIETLTDDRRLWDEVVQPVVSGTVRVDALPKGQPVRTRHDLVHRLLLGWAVLFPPAGVPIGFDLEGVQQRGVGEPTTERQVIGPKEGFVETFSINVVLPVATFDAPLVRQFAYPFLAAEATVGWRWLPLRSFVSLTLLVWYAVTFLVFATYLWMSAWLLGRVFPRLPRRGPVELLGAGAALVASLPLPEASFHALFIAWNIGVVVLGVLVPTGILILGVRPAPARSPAPGKAWGT